MHICMVGRSESYLRKRLGADTFIFDLPVEEITVMAGFFGGPVRELGG